MILLTKSVYQNIITETIFKHRHNKIVINKKKLLNEHILKGIIDRRNLPYRYLLYKNLIHITTEKALKYNKEQGQKPLGTHLKIINCTHNDFYVTVTLYTIILYPSCVCYTILRVSNIGKTQFPSQSWRRHVSTIYIGIKPRNSYTNFRWLCVLFGGYLPYLIKILDFMDKFSNHSLFYVTSMIWKLGEVRW